MELKKYLPYIKKYWYIPAGALGGFMYYTFIGCTTNSCPITSNPWISTLYGAAIGALLVPGKKKQQKEEAND